MRKLFYLFFTGIYIASAAQSYRLIGGVLSNGYSTERDVRYAVISTPVSVDYVNITRVGPMTELHGSQFKIHAGLTTKLKRRGIVDIFLIDGIGFATHISRKVKYVDLSSGAGARVEFKDLPILKRWLRKEGVGIIGSCIVNKSVVRNRDNLIGTIGIHPSYAGGIYINFKK